MDDLINIQEQLASMSINSKNITNKSNCAIEKMVKNEKSINENFGRRIIDAPDLLLSSIATKKKVRSGVCSLKRLGDNRHEVSAKRSLKHTATRRSLFSKSNKMEFIDVNSNAFNKSNCIGKVSSLGVTFNSDYPAAYNWQKQNLSSISTDEDFGNAFNKPNCIGKASSLDVVYNCYNAAAYKWAERDLTPILDDENFSNAFNKTKVSKSISKVSSIGAMFNSDNPAACKWAEQDVTPISNEENWESNTKTSKMDVHYCN